MLRVVMRGEVIDGRGFVKSSLAGAAPGREQHSRGIADVDLDVKFGAVAGLQRRGRALRRPTIRRGAPAWCALSR